MPENRTQQHTQFAKKALKTKSNQKSSKTSTITEVVYQLNKERIPTINNNRHRRSKTSEFSSHSNLKLCNSIFCEEDRRSRANMLFFLHETYIKGIIGPFLDQCGMIHFSPSQAKGVFLQRNDPCMFPTNRTSGPCGYHRPSCQ